EGRDYVGLEKGIDLYTVLIGPFENPETEASRVSFLPLKTRVPFTSCFFVVFDCRLFIPWLLPRLRGKKNQTNSTLTTQGAVGVLQLALLGNITLVLQASKLREQWTILHDKILVSEPLIITSFPSPRPFRPRRLDARLQIENKAASSCRSYRFLLSWDSFMACTSRF
ncbi:hypothetical protein DV515_00017779, partial [Chloebia gouldiae]